jgi:hypothetical protein
LCVLCFMGTTVGTNRCIFPKCWLSANMHIIWVRFETWSALMITGRAHFFLWYSEKFFFLFTKTVVMILSTSRVGVNGCYKGEGQHLSAWCELCVCVQLIEHICWQKVSVCYTCKWYWCIIFACPYQHRPFSAHVQFVVQVDNCLPSNIHICRL